MAHINFGCVGACYSCSLKENKNIPTEPREKRLLTKWISRRIFLSGTVPRSAMSIHELLIGYISICDARIKTSNFNFRFVKIDYAFCFLPFFFFGSVQKWHQNWIKKFVCRHDHIIMSSNWEMSRSNSLIGVDVEHWTHYICFSLILYCNIMRLGTGWMHDCHRFGRMQFCADTRSIVDECICLCYCIAACNCICQQYFQIKINCIRNSFIASNAAVTTHNARIINKFHLELKMTAAEPNDVV